MMIRDGAHLRILVVDAEPGMRRMLRLGLMSNGYVVSEADCGMGALEAVRRDEADLIVLDLGLADLDGFQVIKRIRYAKSYVPIIVLSKRDDEATKVSAFDLGADDYLSKPFRIDELLARIRVLQRYLIQPQTNQKVVRAGELALNLVRCKVTVRGLEVRLSPHEYQLLRLFIAHRGRVLTHGFILRQIWGADSDVQYLHIYVRALRQKIERDPDQPLHIITESGIGYRLHVGDDRVK